MPMQIGRNDPCPCGSGKKFKKCHGTLSLSTSVPPPEVARANALKALDMEMTGRLVRFANARFGPAWLAVAVSAYLDPAGTEPTDAEMGIGLTGAIQFVPAGADGRSLAGLWREDQGQRLSRDTRLLLDAYDASWLSLWEVSEVTPGVGALMTDLLTHQQRFAYDVSASKSLTQFDVLLANVLECDGVSFFGGAHTQPLRPRSGEAVAQDARRICRVRTRPVSVARLRDLSIHRALIDRWRWEVDLMLNRPAPVMQNTDGDPLLLTTDDFELTAPFSDVVDRLRSLPDSEASDFDAREAVFVLTKSGNATHRSWDNTIVGRVVVTGRRLRIETNSTRRANALRTSVEAHLQGMVRFHMRQETNTSALIESARAGGHKRGAEERYVMPPEAVAAVRQFREQHMTAWLDDSIPALDGLTPRHAATLPRMRHSLDALLKEFDQSEARLPVEERIDIRRVRVALGRPVSG